MDARLLSAYQNAGLRPTEDEDGALSLDAPPTSQTVVVPVPSSTQQEEPAPDAKVADYVKSLMTDRDAELKRFDDNAWKRRNASIASIVTGNGPMKDDSEATRAGIVNHYASLMAQGREKEFDLAKERMKLDAEAAERRQKAVEQAKGLGALKTALHSLYDQELKTRGISPGVIDSFDSKDALEAFKNSLENDKNRGAQVDAAKEAAKVGRDYQYGAEQRAATRESDKEKRARAEREDDRINTAVESLGKAIPQGATSFFTQADAVDSILEKVGPKGDIPGVGAVDSRVPFDSLKSDDALKLQKNVKQMMLAYRNLVTGTGGSVQEMEKIDEAGAQMNNERSFLAGYKALKDGYTAYLNKVRASYPPEAVARFEKRLGTKLLPDQKEATSGPPAGAVKKQVNRRTGAVRYLDAKGEVIP